MRIVSYNIRFGGRGRTDAIGSVLASLDPDVVLLQEAFDATAARRIADVAGLDHVHQQPGWSVAALLREPAIAHHWHQVWPARGFLELRPAGAPAHRLVNVHLPAGLSRRRERARLRHVDVVLRTLGDGAAEDTLIVGDLNSVASGDEPLVRRMPVWIRLLIRFDGRTRTDVLDRLVAAGWVDAFRHLHPGVPGFTLPAADPHVRLDYALVPPDIRPRLAACAPSAGHPLVARASDHLPLVLDVDP